MNAQSEGECVCWLALTGFTLGALSGTTYLLCDGEYLFNVPRWAAAVFYPGFVAGFQAYGWGLGEPAAKIVGVAAVGLMYALIAAALDFAWLAVRSPKPTSPANPSTDSGSQVPP